jgi:hypothetical protein
MPFAEAVAQRQVPQALLESMNHACPACKTIFLTDLADRGKHPGYTDAEGGWQAFLAHAKACIAEHPDYFQTVGETHGD